MSLPGYPRQRTGRLRAAGALAAVLIVAGSAVAAGSPASHHGSAAAPATQTPTGCAAPVGNPNPKTQRSAWVKRDFGNMLCSTQRLLDEVANPDWIALSAMEFAGSNPGAIFGAVSDPRLRSWGAVLPAGGDPFRVPTRWVAMGRGQFEEFTFLSMTGAKLSAELFSPNPHPGANYPVVTFSPGLQEAKEQAWWYGEGLAEAGYVVLMIDPQDQGDSEVLSHPPSSPLRNVPTTDKPETQSAAEFAISTPRNPYRWATGSNAKGTLHYNPLWREVDQHELGIAGHSLGAAAATPIGQAMKQVKAVVSYDDLDLPIPASLTSKIHAPALYFGTDYAFPTFATPKLPGDPPNPNQHLTDFDQMVKAGIDSMVVTPRASTHYEWDEQSAIGSLPASRYGQVVSFYYTLAWFDRYLKHEESGLRRLIALRFNGSADRHSIGVGRYSATRALADPTNPFAGNLPYRIKGRCAANLLSFYYASAYWLDGGDVRSSNMRNRGCAAKG